MTSKGPASGKATLWLNGAFAPDISRAAAILQSGGLVAMPTETVYGLAANALDPIAVEQIFRAKDRPQWDPLIVHIVAPKLDKSRMLLRVAAHASGETKCLMEAFWPGPLTLLLPRHSQLPLAVTAGRGLVGVRAPAHPVARALIAESGLPLAAPSANRFGHISPTTPQHVQDDLGGRIEAILDAGPCSIGIESTVYNPSSGVIYRQGSVSHREIEQCVRHPVTLYKPDHEGAPAVRESLPSPGVGIRHYAPSARLILVEDHSSLIAAQTELDPRTTAVILPIDWLAPAACERLVLWAAWNDSAALAARLYAVLREADAPGIRTVLCPCPTHYADPLENAIRDRLQKAALSH